MKSYHVYGLGNALVDKEFEVSDDFFVHENIQKGVMTLVDAESQEVLLARLLARFGLKKRAGGGSAANTMYAISQFGGKTYYSCKVASDEFGDFYVEELGSHNIKTNLGPARDYGVTGKCLVMVSPDAERTMLTCLGISEQLSSADLDIEALRDSQFLYLEGYLVTSATGRQACVEARKIAEANGVRTSLTLSDPAMVQFFRGGLEEMIGSGVDLLFANHVEAQAWTGIEDIRAAARSLSQIARVVVVTLGANGALVWDGNSFTEIAPVPAKAIDTNGAGDMFAGAFLYAVATGRDYATAGRLASHAAAQTVSTFGPRLSPAEHQQILQQAFGAS
jgi:sugar/nucleoside kinase (ribokinase family)